MEKVDLAKLMGALEFDFEDDIPMWADDEDGFTLEDIKYAIGKEESINEVYSIGQWDGKEGWTKKEHIRRIIYFIDNPEEIHGIVIDNFRFGNKVIDDKAMITDGNHRLVAAVYLGLDQIECVFEGKDELLDKIRK